MADPKSPKVLCVPVNSKRLTSSARSALTGARNAARGYRRMKRRQLNKARGQLAKQGGLSVQSQQSLKFRRDEGLLGGGLTLPFRLVKADTIDRDFESAIPDAEFDDTFLEELFSSRRKADAAIYADNANAVIKVSNPSSTVDLTSYDIDAVEGSWLLYFGLNNRRVDTSNDLLAVRFGNDPSDLRRARDKGFNLKDLVAQGPVRIVFLNTDSIMHSLPYTRLLGVNNNWRYFNIPSGVANVDASRINQTFSVPAGVITESNFTWKPVPERPYGPDFNAIRPPGTPEDFDYAALAEGVSSRDVINFYNKILRECWTAIRDRLQGAERDKFLEHYPRSNSLSLPKGAFDTSSTALWGRTAALANSVYEVSPVSFDIRADAQDNPPTSTIDPGPFNEARGLLTDGTALVKGPRRPKGKRYDNRFGSLVILHEDEVAAIALQDINVGPLAGRAYNRAAVPESFAKLEHIVRLRVKYANDLMYGPYNDYATIAALFRIELGETLFNSYNEDPATMLDVFTSTNINNNIPNNIFKETWGTLAIRIVMGSKYSDVGQLPNVSGTDRPPENADRLLPFKAPEQDNVITVYGDSYSPDLNGAEIRNYGHPDVHNFDFGQRALFRNVPAKRIVIHWGGTQRGYLLDDGGAIAAMLSNTRHSPSTHFTVNHQGTVVNQHAELSATTGHAYGFNFDSAGVDIPNIGAILKKYKSSTVSGYTNIGYTVIDTPFYKYALGKMLISPINQYETMYTLIKAICDLRNPQQGIHTDQLQFDPDPVGVSSIDGKTVVAVSSFVGAKNSEKFRAFQGKGGVCCHLHVATNGKTDGVDGYIYYTLRHKMGDNSQDAYRRMKLTLQGNVKQTAEGLRYLVLDRS